MSGQQEIRDRYDRLLVERLGLEGRLGEVARHALQGGKRLRPILAEGIGYVLKAPPEAVVEIALAVEYLHTASMILDDLPCMDDASQRRGAPAAHVRFSQAEAILAAVALVSRSYALLLQAPVPGSAEMARLAAETVAGAMAPGQAAELAAPSQLSTEAVESIHQRKTAALFVLVGQLVARAAGASAPVSEDVAALMMLLGRAYQIIDDIEDRDEPGEARGNIARLMSYATTRGEANRLLAESRALASRLDAGGVLTGFVDALEARLPPVDPARADRRAQ